MQKKDYMNIAYEIAKKELPADGFEFDKLWKIVARHLDMKIETFKNDLLGDFYTDLLQNGKFVFLGDNMWILRENIDFDSYQKLRDSISDKDLDLNLSDAEYGGYEPEYFEIVENEYGEKNSDNDEDEELENENELVESDFDNIKILKSNDSDDYKMLSIDELEEEEFDEDEEN